ncbi:MAG: hypothetical protein HZB56_00380 [Deltaproteobacteria bacterium]|nr:hypothetical protein [Deltaproteobacteria bacterium]
MRAARCPAWLSASLLLLAGCPLPQALPETVAGGTGGFGPRIAFELVAPQSTFVDVGKACATPPRFDLHATVVDRDQLEAVKARWFVDYHPATNFGIARQDDAAGNGQDFLRPLPSFAYVLQDGAGEYPVHVVDLVVSNGFKDLDLSADALPNRMPVPGRDTQTFRWVFRYVDSGGSCP